MDRENPEDLLSPSTDPLGGERMSLGVSEFMADLCYKADQQEEGTKFCSSLLQSGRIHTEIKT